MILFIDQSSECEPRFFRGIFKILQHEGRKLTGSIVSHYSFLVFLNTKKRKNSGKKYNDKAACAAASFSTTTTPRWRWRPRCAPRCWSSRRRWRWNTAAGHPTPSCSAAPTSCASSAASTWPLSWLRRRRRRRRPNRRNPKAKRKRRRRSRRRAPTNRWCAACARSSTSTSRPCWPARPMPSIRHSFRVNKKTNTGTKKKRARHRLLTPRPLHRFLSRWFFFIGRSFSLHFTFEGLTDQLTHVWFKIWVNSFEHEAFF